MGPLTQLLLSLLLLPSPEPLETLGLFLPVAITGKIQAQSTEADNLSAEVAKLYQEGKYSEAIPLAKRELQMREGQLGHDSKPTAVSLSRLATLYFALKEYEAAELNYRESLAVYERIKEGNNLNVAKITDRLAFLSYQKQDYAQTETFYLRSLAIRETVREPGNANLIQSMSNLIQFYRSFGRYEKASSIYKRMLALDHTETAETLEDYACTLRRADKDSEAKKIEERVNRIVVAPKNVKEDTDSDVDILNGQAIVLPPPELPSFARAARLFGRVRVRILINESGQVIRACAVSGPKVFYSESEAAALKARFTPTLKGGRATKVVGSIMYNFQTR
jgi:tetratricopeptide (TPR) repeat protein